MSEAVYIGIDVSKARLDVAVRPTGEIFSHPNTLEGIAQLVQHLQAQTPCLIVLEPTGGYEQNALIELAQVGLPVVLVNARQVRDFAKATGKLAKTDRLDAQVLAHFAQVLQPEIRPLADVQARSLEAGLTRRRQVVEMLTMEKNRLQSTRDLRARADIEAHITFLESRKTQLEAELLAQVSVHSTYQDRFDLLSTVPGVGPMTALTLLADLPELGQLSGRQLAALVGVAPLNRDSGTMKKRRGIFAGRAEVRTMLYMASQTAVRYNPSLKAFYTRLRERGKAHKQALIACARKLLNILNAMVKSNTPWSAKYYQEMEQAQPVG